MKITKQNILAATAALALLAGAGSKAMGDTIILSTNGYSGASHGGEFAASVGSANTYGIDLSAYAASTKGIGSNINGGSLSTFETFCVESNVTFSPGTQYNFTASQYAAKEGGFLTIGVAYLYSQFAAGTLSGYDYSASSSGGLNTHTGLAFGSRAQAADGLQWAIWYLGHQNIDGTNTAITLTDVINNGGGVFMNDIITAGYTTTTEFNQSNGLDNVAALVLTDGSGNYHQDQLAMVLPGTPGLTSVADGGTTVMLMGMAMSGLAFLKRKIG